MHPIALERAPPQGGPLGRLTRGATTQASHCCDAQCESSREYRCGSGHYRQFQRNAQRQGSSTGPSLLLGSGVSSSLDLKAGNNILRLDRFRGIPIETVTPLAFEKGAPASLQQSADRGPNIGIPKRAAFIRNHWQLAARSHSLPNYFMFEANAHCAQDREPKPIEQRQIRKAKSLTHYHDANSPAPNRINGFRRMKRSEVSTRYFAYLRHVAWQGGPQGRVVIMFFTSGEGIL